MEKRGGAGPSSLVSSLIAAQEKSIVELKKMSRVLAEDSAIAVLKAQLLQASHETSSGSGDLQVLKLENAQLCKEVADLK